MKVPFLLLSMLFSLHQVTLAQSPTTITVEGKSELQVMPDEALIRVNLSTKALKTSEATQALNDKTKAVEASLKKTGSENYTFKAANYYVNVNRIYTRGSAKDSGYVAAQTLEITVKDTAEELIKIVEALHQSADMGFQLNFRLSREKTRDYQDQLLKMALEDAQRKAKLIAETMGLAQTKVNEVDYGSKRSFQPVPYRMEAMMMKDSEDRTAPTLVPEEQTISDQVKVVFLAE
ncbi:SIMPL domain-containing protein [Pleomorphovibrio marinus]|uniref:SIMPL domain-containing protein n=1 Tax=Pleomorphovibrio marinus TaxID=2164132 RepID=UPI000E0B89DA|nr:SIMPL domain-containing protein [Pleomorphovibrio marinus]